MQSDSMLEFIRQGLVRAVADRHHAWRTPVVSTVSSDGPNARCVVLRAAQSTPFCLRFFTDVRSAKVSELQQDARMHWVFWNPKAQLQLRLSTIVALLQEGDAVDQAWTRVPESARRDYASITGGGVDLGLARQHFTLGVATVRRMEYLHLDRSGHSRGAWAFDAGVLMPDSYMPLPP
jgi:general stress protein 26